jgi:isochorismate hydrolase
MMAHASLATLFTTIPVVMTTSAETGLFPPDRPALVLTDFACPGPNGPLPHEILEMYPDAPLIKRQGEVDAWDNEDFRKAIKATGKTQVIIAGIVTDACKCSF